MTVQALKSVVRLDLDADSGFLMDAIDGLTSTPKSLPSKYFYDERGSVLFEQICELEEYYLTRTELAIMHRHVQEMAEAIGENALLIEPGSGASVKVRLLLRHLTDPSGYVPMDISSGHLMRWAHLLHQEVPSLLIMPVHADFSECVRLPPMPESRRRVIYFPGSTIGNFTPGEARTWLTHMATMTGAEGGLLIGVDLKKDRATLEAAYNDASGVTREFNLNILEHMRRELDADVDVDRFEHRAVYNEAEGRIEMHLVSKETQTIGLDGAGEIQLEAGETIHTENSYKYDLEQFRRLVEEAGWRRVAGWTDENAYFSVQYFERG